MTSFEKLGLLPELIEAVAEMGWNLPRDVQDEAIPLILGGADVMIAAETGSGKTGAFGLPLVQLCYEHLQGHAKLVDAPTAKEVPVVRGPSGWTNIGMSMRDRDSFVAVAEGGSLCQARQGNSWGGARANLGVKSGSYYFEAKVTDEGLCRVGWATNTGTLNVGVDKFSLGFGGTGMKSHNKSFEKYGEAFGLNDVIGCYLSHEHKTVSFTKNGSMLGEAYTLPQHLVGVPLYPALVLKNAEMRLDFNPSTAVLDGYQAIGQADVNAAVQNKISEQEKKKQAAKGPLCVILEPSKDLAHQVYEEIEKFAARLQNPPVRVCFTIGGMDAKIKNKNEKLLANGAEIIVGTLGSLASLHKSKKLNMTNVQYFVMDEADAMLDRGDLNTVWTLHDAIKTSNAQKLICSATLHSNGITALADRMCVFPQWVDLKGRDAVPDTVDHIVCYVNPREDDAWRTTPAEQEQKLQGYLSRLEKAPYLSGCGDVTIPTDRVHSLPQTESYANVSENEEDDLSYGVKRLKLVYLLQLLAEFKPEQCMLFVRTQVDCDNLEKFLLAAGKGQKFHNDNKVHLGPLSCVVVHGGRSSKDRLAGLAAFKEGRIRFLICTDVAARGIDVAGLPMIINVTLPADAATYIHRVGRVGRAGAAGIAISLTSTVPERVWWHSNSCQDRKNRGARCKDVGLVDLRRNTGGCTTFFDENEVIQAVETRLAAAHVIIPTIDIHDLSAERGRVMRTLTETREHESRAAIEYVEALKPIVKELAELERQTQTAYHLNMQRWNQSSSSS